MDEPSTPANEPKDYVGLWLTRRQIRHLLDKLETSADPIDQAIVARIVKFRKDYGI